MHMSKDGIWVVLYPRSCQAGILVWRGTCAFSTFQEMVRHGSSSEPCEILC